MFSFWRPTSTMNELRRDIERILEAIPIDFGGGCSASKAHVLAYLIRRFNLQKTIDIGVYRGRSLFPQALAHAAFTGGTVYGVDPWSRDHATENDNPRLSDAITRFVAATDYDSVYAGVCTTRESLGYEKHCLLVRDTSARAAASFRERGLTFGLIHIDGNHDTETVVHDVETYTPLLEPGGFLVLDDVSWDSVKPAYERARRSMRRLFQRIDASNDYAVFQGETAMLRSIGLRLKLQQIGRR